MIRTAVIALALLESSSALVSRSPMKMSTFERPKGRDKASSKRLISWTPDSSDISEFAFGLPGAVEPFPDGFDPLGIAEKSDLVDVKKYREAETQHGRVAMLAAVGFLVGENYHPLFGMAGKQILAIDSLTEVRLAYPWFFWLLTGVIGAFEINRAKKGWVDPIKFKKPTDYFKLNEDYFPGDVGFDPFNLMPTDPDNFATMQTKELQNGRLAMLAVAGMVAQELVDRTPILFRFGIGGPPLDPSNPLF
jgi:hypothetical protein